VSFNFFRSVLEHSLDLLGEVFAVRWKQNFECENKGDIRFYVENHLWPNGGIKTTTYLSRISTNTFTNTGQVRYTM